MRPGGSCSDLDSVVTEDYESRFQDVMVMQTPSAPIRNIDRFIIDHDLDMIESRASQRQISTIVRWAQHFYISNDYLIYFVI